MTKFAEARREWERQYMLWHLAQHKWNISATARELGMDRSSLHVVVKRLGMARPKKSAAECRVDTEAPTVHDRGVVDAQSTKEEGQNGTAIEL